MGQSISTAVRDGPLHHLTGQHKSSCHMIIRCIYLTYLMNKNALFLFSSGLNLGKRGGGGGEEEGEGEKRRRRRRRRRGRRGRGGERARSGGIKI